MIVWPLMPGLVWPVPVVVPGIGPQHRPQMTLAVDQHTVGALGPHGPLPGVVNWSAPCTGSITLMRVTEILLPLWSVTVYTVPTGPDRLFDGEGLPWCWPGPRARCWLVLVFDDAAAAGDG